MNQNKRMLFVCAKFFNIYKQIIIEFERRGYQVDFYNDRPSECALIKSIIRFKRGLVAPLTERYYNRIVDEIKDKKYEIVFIINCKVLTPSIMTKLRRSQKEAKFVLYMWDPINLYPQAIPIIPCFDAAFSFDSEDCNKHPDLTLLPLFYSKPYEDIGKIEGGNIEYDIANVCTAHSIRYKIIKELFPIWESQGIKVFSYMFAHRLRYLHNKVFFKEYKKAKRSEFRYKPLSEVENADIIRKSNAVLDIAHNMQSGLTLRTMEAFGAKRKLITTNANIKNYDLYSENNIYILDEFNQSGVKEFLQQKYEPIDDDIYKKYSIRNWVKNIGSTPVFVET